MLRAGLISLAVLLSACPGYAQSDPTITAQRAAQQLDAANRALQDAEDASDRVAALTATIRAYEEGLQALRQGLRQVAIRESALRQEFEARSSDLSRLLAALQSMERSPAPLLLLHPSGPAGTARSAMILSEITPALEAEARDLRLRLDEITLLQAIQQSAADQLSSGLSGVQTARAALSVARADRVDLPRRFVQDADAMRALLDSSETLRAFAIGLTALPETTQRAPVPGDTASHRFSDQQGRLSWPVSGRVLRGYNTADAAGVVRPGVVVATRPEALVTAPAAATIRYAGPLLDYGNVIILEPDNAYLMVLAGLGTIYGRAGEVVSDGAPLGLMRPAAGSNSSTTGTVGGGAGRSESLYMELRHENEPTDPTPWFVPADG